MTKFTSKKLKHSLPIGEKFLIDLHVLTSILIKKCINGRCAMCYSKNTACIFLFLIFQTPYILRIILYSFTEEETI